MITDYMGGGSTETPKSDYVIYGWLLTAYTGHTVQLLGIIGFFYYYHIITTPELRISLRMKIIIFPSFSYFIHIQRLF